MSGTAEAVGATIAGGGAVLVAAAGWVTTAVGGMTASVRAVEADAGDVATAAQAEASAGMLARMITRRAAAGARGRRCTSSLPRSSHEPTRITCTSMSLLDARGGNSEGITCSFSAVTASAAAACSTWSTAASHPVAMMISPTSTAMGKPTSWRPLSTTPSHSSAWCCSGDRGSSPSSMAMRSVRSVIKTPTSRGCSGAWVHTSMYSMSASSGGIPAPKRRLSASTALTTPDSVGVQGKAPGSRPRMLRRYWYAAMCCVELFARLLGSPVMASACGATGANRTSMPPSGPSVTVILSAAAEHGKPTSSKLTGGGLRVTRQSGAS